MQDLKSRGFDVVFCAQDNGYAEEVVKKGFTFFSLEVDRKGTNFITDLKLICLLYRIYRRERPDIILHYTIKPNIYGSMAAKMAGIPCINTITGLGYVFINDNQLIYYLVKLLYKISCSFAERILFQNRDDLELFIEKKLVNQKKAVLVRGSGVNMSFYNPDSGSSVENDEKAFVFLFTGRILWDKGIGEFIKAAKSAKEKYPTAQFWLVGIIDLGNPKGISEAKIRGWEREGIIIYYGEVKDVRPFILRADCVVLPSYREGIPRSLLEALAMGKPIITTNAVGCREVIEDGVNGFCVPVKDWRALANSFYRMIELSPGTRLKMGNAGREKVKKEFEESIIIDTYVQEIQKVLKGL
jgi:glycosyltransferase involved in cell wall biosynthesis